MAGGKAKSFHPLGRCSVFGMLHREILQAAKLADAAVDATDSKMAALAFDDDSKMIDARARPKKSAKVTAVSAPIIENVAVKDCPSAVAENRRVIAVLRGRQLYLQVDGVSWLANYLREELSTGGVDPVRDEEPRSGPSIFGDWRDELWVFRKQETDGAPRRRSSKPVRSRIAKSGDLNHLDFEAAKQYVYDEFEQQLRSAGEILSTSESMSGDSQS